MWYLILSSGLVLWTCTSHIGQYLLVSKYRTMHILQTVGNKNKELTISTHTHVCLGGGGGGFANIVKCTYTNEDTQRWWSRR